MPRGPIHRLLFAACCIAVSLSARAEGERNVIDDPRLFRAHKPNYILPLSTTNRVNRAVYTAEDADLAARLKAEEVAFQMSLKVQFNADPLFRAGDAVFFGFTLKSWWQLYSPDISSPFRETNYQPELFYTAPLQSSPFGADTTLTLGLEHQSNGQVQAYSRSWNRLYAELALHTERAFVAVRPWYRLPEDPKPSPDSALGDDNPDIDDFLGRTQVQLGWHGEHVDVSGTLHGSLSTGKGGLTVMLSYPLFKRFRGVVQFVDGYGDSLLDYNHKQRRLGLGVLLSDLF
ncbi:MAG: phospholipase A [Pseudomonadota bacterium]